VRGGAELFTSETSDEPIGTVTSGGFGPSVNAPVAMGYLPTEFAKVGTLVFAEVRGQKLPMRLAAMPFTPHSYKR
jgi:aminomethyltransferase